MGNTVEYIKMALQNIRGNKARSFLTMLGIIIGISSVIAIVSIGEGTKHQMNAEVDDMGSGQICVYCGNKAEEAGAYITPEDMDMLCKKTDGIKDATPDLSDIGTTHTDKGEFQLAALGGTSALKYYNNFDMKRGSYFTQADVEEANKVCVISDADAKRLFGSDDVVGMNVDLTMENKTYSYRIEGVSKQKKNGAFVSYSYDGAPVSFEVPYTTFTDYGWDITQLPELYLFTADKADTQKVTDAVIHTLDSSHLSAGEDYFQIDSFKDALKEMNSMLSMVTLFISFVAAISLLVGGIGVMNIMLVSVTERTKEIGIRKALGAKTSSIMVQFLCESAILTAVGGVIGIVLGILGAHGICAVFSRMMKTTIRPGISVRTVLFATVFSSLVGIFFGIYPARKAARLSPIEALRRD